MRKFFLVVGFFCSLWLFGQSPEIQARAAFMSAQELYGKGDYAGAIERLDNVKELLGSSNPRVEYLLCQSHFANRDAEKAEAALKNYFEMADESDPNYNQMLLMIEEIKTKKEEFRLEQERIDREQEMAEKEPEVWAKVQELNTREAYQVYLDTYPQGEYVLEAGKALRQFPPAKLVDPRNGYSYKTVWIGNQVWMTSNLLNPYDGTHFISYDQRLAICPDGWRLPSRADYEIMLKSLGADLSNKKYKLLPGPSGLYTYKNVGVFEMLALSVQGDDKWQGTNSSGFAALPKEPVYASRFAKGKNKAVFWASDGYIIIDSSGDVEFAVFLKGYKGISRVSKIPCRCIKGGTSVSSTDQQSALEDEARNAAIKMLIGN